MLLYLEIQALDSPIQRVDLLRQLFTDIALEVDSRARGESGFTVTKNEYFPIRQVISILLPT